MSHQLSFRSLILTALFVVVFAGFAPQAAFAITANVSVPAATTQGTPFTVTWSSTGATSCTVTGPGFSASGLSGSQSTTQTTTGTKNYSIVCSSGACTWNQTANDQECFVSSNPAGCFQGGACTPSGSTCETGSVKFIAGEPVCLNHNTYTCGGACTSANQTASTVVSTPPAPTVTVTSPTNTIAYPGSTTITWSSTNATSCFESSAAIATGGATSGSATVSPIANTTYTFNCTGYGGSGSGSKTITVTGVPAATATLNASPGTVALGSNATLTWSSNFATSCAGVGFPTGGATSGSQTVTPATNTTYTVNCTGQGGTGTASVGVGVTGGGAASVIVFDNHDGYMHQYVDDDATAHGGIANPGVSGIYAGTASERNRTCYLVDPTAYPTAFSTRSYNSPGNNTVLKFGGVNWTQVGANGSNIKYSHLTCASNSAPDTSLTANGSATNITVTSGTAVNLTWLSQYGEVRQGTCSAQNFSTYTWVPGYWQNQWECVDSCGNGGNCAIAPKESTLARGAESVLTFFGIMPETAHALANGCIRTQVWVPGSYQNVPFSGTTTVNPTVTTTYTYTCANAIGSTQKSITVTIPTGPACSDGLDNDGDGLIDLADPGCSSATDTSEEIECQDGINNDTADTNIDLADLGCMNASDDTEDPNPPPVPTGLSSTCNAAGTSVSLDWADVVGTSGYYLRVSKPSGTNCPSGWVTPTWSTTTCIPSPDLVNSSAYANYPVSTGVAYTWSVHSRGSNAEWSQPATGSFTCVSTLPQCGDGIDNDSDGRTDTADPSCTGSTDTTEGPASPTANLTGSASVPTGNAGSLTWACGNSTSASISGIGAVTPVVGGTRSTGTLTNPPATANYQLTCSSATESVTDNHVINVTIPTVDITATPDRVNATGNNTTLIKWSSSTDVDDCTVTKNNVAFGSGANNLTGTQTTVTSQTVFDASCTSAGVAGAATDSVIVNVNANLDEF